MIMLFANKIRRLREEQQLLQRQLAAALEIDTPMYRIDEYDVNESVETPDSYNWVIIDE